MNKKGFTLAELLGVIILLSIIAIIAISTTGTNLEEGRQKACLAQGKNIIEAMKAYMVDNPNELPADENIEFSKKVEFLITHGYLAEDFTNPSTEKKYADDTYAVVMLRGSNYIYRVRYTPDDKCDLESGKKDEIEDNVKINQPGITSTKDSITVTANASANDGIESYEFSINGGTTWQNNGSNNIYTFTGLEDDKEYTILVRTTTKNGYIDVKRKSAETKIADAIISPQASSGSNTTVNLTYPIGCTNGKYTCTYTKDSETAVTITETTTSVNFVGSGTIATEVKSNRKPTNKLTNSQNITIKFTASFLKGSNVDTIGKTSEACTVTSGNTTCEVTLPSITRKTGCTIIGWGSSNTATSGTAAGQKVALSKNTTYYANSRLNVLTMKLHMNGGSRDTSSDTAISNSGSYITRGGTTEFYKVKYNATTNPWNYNNPGGVNIKRNGYAAVSKKQWCTASDGTGTCIDQDKEYKAQEIYSSVADADKTITLYVNWVANVVDISSKVTTQAEASCKGYWRDYRYRFTIDYHGSSPSSGYMCYNRPSEGSKYCGNYKNNTNTTAGDACFTKDDTWDFYRSTGRVDIYVKAANGASKATYATK